MYSIGELSRHTGVKIATIRYYEQEKLIEEPDRSRGNQRRYTRAGLDRVSFIKHSRELGLSIADIRELIDLGINPEMPCEGAHKIASRHLQAVQHRIGKLKRLEKELKRITKHEDNGLIGECNVFHALSDHALCDGQH